MEEFTTSTGVTLHFKSIAMRLESHRQAFKMPDPPTYEVKVFGGGVERHPHDDTTLEVPADPEQTERNRTAWAEYLRQLAEANGAYGQSLLRLILTYGTDATMPEDDGWAKKQRRCGYVVPDDPELREQHWLDTEVAQSEDDVMQIVAHAFSASGLTIDKEAIAHAEASFRGDVPRDTLPQTADESERVAGVGPLHADARGGPKRDRRHRAV